MRYDQSPNLPDSPDPLVEIQVPAVMSAYLVLALGVSIDLHHLLELEVLQRRIFTATHFHRRRITRKSIARPTK